MAGGLARLLEEPHKTGVLSAVPRQGQGSSRRLAARTAFPQHGGLRGEMGHPRKSRGSRLRPQTHSAIADLFPPQLLPNRLALTSARRLATSE